ncbi:helix-turn-helix domain-containing protein [Gordonibacter sp.]|uniref:helix-turn-helix domain-containing protein n=1 Tax=Gordonibacter sp. TaxID=1968902 RepID=UPI002FCB5FDC
MDSAKLLLHPTRLRVLQYLRLHDRAATSAIVAYLQDVPRATAYHHVKLLEEGGVIEMVEENQVRGVYEKVYAFKNSAIPTSGEASEALSSAYFLELMQEMNAYLGDEGCDCAQDRVFFQTALLCVSDAEYDQLLKGIADLLKPYVDREMGAGRRMRKLSLVSSPPAASGREPARSASTGEVR